jgi:predicted secreted protein
MPRESIITVLRSTSTDVPSGLTFGEISYSDLNGKFFIGKNDGTSLWIGAQITSGDISTNSQYIVPTQSAVKSYVDGVVGGGGAVVNTVNGTGGNIVVTGDNGAVIKVTSGATNTISARLATTSVTGVASFTSADFTVSAVGAVGLKDVVRSVNGLTGTVTITGDGGSLIGRTNNSFTNRLADASATGVASFSSTYFSVSSGAVSLASAYQATGDTVITVAGSGIAISTSGKTDTLFNIGVTGFNGLTGNITVTGDGGSLIGLDNNKFTNRLATTGVTGVASFNATRFSVTNGAVDLAAAYQATGDTVQAGSGIAIGSGKTITNIGVTGFNGLTGNITVTGDGGSLVGRDNNKFTNRLADTSVTGVASFNSTYFTVSSGAVSLASAYQATGDTVITVAGSGIAISTSGKTDTLFNIGVTGFNGLTGNITVTGDGGSLIGADNNKFTNRLATTGVTGVASFNSTHFSVSSGAVSSTGITVKASTSDTGTTLNLGGTLTITGTASQVSVSRSNTEFTIGLPNDITIPGNLTVNGTVVTANVDSFVVEDPLIMLGTGNAADSVDLGFYGQYTSSGKRFAGIFRDASDSGKFKFFTGLSGGVEPTTFVNDSGSGYTVATVVARIDGGTF